ncbi:MAG: amidohydrolase [Nocardioidaceae bacterium]
MTMTVLRGGHILAPGYAGATAMGVAHGLVTWVGDDAVADQHQDTADDVVRLHGALVTPAFVDAHVHLAQTGLSLQSLDLAGAAGLTEALDRLHRFAATSTAAVLLGFGWDETGWPEARPPTGDEVDRAVGDRPAYLSRVDGHSALISTALATRATGVQQAPGWDGTGRVERDAHHVARAAAHALVTSGQRREALAAALRHAAAAGIGCVHELGAPHISSPVDFAVIKELGTQEPLPTVIGYWGELGDEGIATAQATGCRGAAGDLCTDGAFGSRTAALESDYDDAPGHAGHAYLDRHQVAAHVAACTRAGLQAGFHCIGDRGVRAAVEGMADAARDVGVDAFRSARHRLEHVELIDPDLITTMARLGVVASVQPAFDAAWGGTSGMYAQRLGSSRAIRANPFAAMAAEGVVLAFGSDSPVTPLDPWGGVRGAVRHHHEGARLATAAAFAAHTRGGWQAAGHDDAGTLVPGAPATYSVWDDAEDLHGGLPTLSGAEAAPRCTRTVVDGRTIFNA